MWMIFYSGKPATMEMLCKADGRDRGFNNVNPDAGIAYRTREQAISIYLHYFGREWKYRNAGVECLRIREFG